MIKRTVIFLVALLSLSAINSFAAITDVAISDNTIAITGTGFGANSQDFEWTGGNIENGVVGEHFAKDGWSNEQDSITCRYDSTTAHSGNKSVLFRYDDALYDVVSSSSLEYEYPNPVSEMYFTFYVRLDRYDSDEIQSFQWKNPRIKNLSGYNLVVPGSSGIYGDMWWYGDNYYLSNRGWGNNAWSVTRNGVTYSPWGFQGHSDAFVFNEWQRVEYWWKKSSANGAADGVYEARRVGYSGEIITARYDLVTHDATNADQDYRYILLGQYYGNLKNADGSEFTGSRHMDVRFDDIYISQSRARVEMGNASTFAACTHREIQPALTWSDTGITGTFNQGSFETGDTVYFFVVDEDGIPSDGYPVTIGGEPVIANPIVEILTESGQTTTASVFTITGTATADTGQTISGVTCSGQTVTPDDGTWDEQSEAFTCLANLALGENTLVFIGSDGTRTGGDSITVTRIQKTSKINGSATIKNATIHQ